MAQKSNRRRVSDLPAAERPINRLLAAGAAQLANIELLAAVLQTADALDLAQDILSAAGGLGDLVDRAPQLVQLVDGLGLPEMARILAAVELGRRAAAPRPEPGERMDSPAKVAAAVDDMAGLRQEELHTLVLDTRSRLLERHQVYKGSLNTCVIRPAEILRPAVLRSAAAVIVVHNHPSGDPAPSPEDLRVTREIAAAGKALGIDLLDHLIVGNGRYVSLKERGDL